jgi:glycosyltransferase involved in cell wall biosynthesis
MNSAAASLADMAAVVATVGRKAPLERLLRSLAAQSIRPREVIVVDQNEQPLDDALLHAAAAPLKLIHLHCPPGCGVSWARNVGWRQSDAAWLLFPDDDCWYPPEYLEKALSQAAQTQADVLCGRAADLSGRTINGRFAAHPGPVAPRDVFVCQIEWNMLIGRDVLHATGGYDEAISPGGATPWQGGEGYDLLLRAIALEFRCHYDPELVAHHDELSVTDPDDAMVRKGRDYGRGLGRVLALHGFGMTGAGYWLGRSLVNLALSVLRGRPDRARYFLHQAVGRIEGWLGRTLALPPHRAEPIRAAAPAVPPWDRLEAPAPILPGPRAEPRSLVAAAGRP